MAFVVDCWLVVWLNLLSLVCFQCFKCNKKNIFFFCYYGYMPMEILVFALYLELEQFRF